MSIKKVNKLVFKFRPMSSLSSHSCGRRKRHLSLSLLANNMFSINTCFDHFDGKQNLHKKGTYVAEGGCILL